MGDMKLNKEELSYCNERVPLFLFDLPILILADLLQIFLQFP